MHVDSNGLSPIEKFSSTPEKMCFDNLHTWGSPCFVLDERLQGQNIIPKWDPRSQFRIYLGHSPCHAGSVALVLNPKTFHVSPQYHLAFDDDFLTAPYLATEDVPPNWKELVVASELATAERYGLAELWCKNQVDPPLRPADREGELVSILKSTNSEGSAHDVNKELHSVSFAEEPTMVSEGGATNKNTKILWQPTLPDLDGFTRRKSTRTPKPSAKVKEISDSTTKSMFGLASSATAFTAISHKVQTLIVCVVEHSHGINRLFDGTINRIHHFAFSVSSDSNDTFTLSQMLKRDDVKETMKKGTIGNSLRGGTCRKMQRPSLLYGHLRLKGFLMAGSTSINRD